MKTQTIKTGCKVTLKDVEAMVRLLSKTAKQSKSDHYAELKTASDGSLCCYFLSNGRVKITFKDRKGIQEGSVRDWTITKTLRRFEDLMKM